MSRPLRERTGTAVVTMCGIGILLAGGWWSMRSIPPRTPTAQLLADAPHADLPPRIPLDASVFDQGLWHAPRVTTAQPEQPTRTTPPPPPPPPAPANIALTLIAMVQNGDEWHVALYDPGEQELVLAAAGDRVAGVLVREVTDRSVLLELAGRTRRLALVEEAP